MPLYDAQDGGYNANTYGSNDFVLVPQSLLEDMQRRLDDMQYRMDKAEEERDEVMLQLQAVQTRLDHVVFNRNRLFEGLFSKVEELRAIQNHHSATLLKPMVSSTPSPVGNGNLCSSPRPQLSPPPSPPTSRHSSQAPSPKPSSNSLSRSLNPWQKPRHTSKNSENCKARE